MLAGGQEGLYQGISFRAPFFFLLVESLESSDELLAAGVAVWLLLEELEESAADCPA
jgi:hypothetical protein